MRELTLCPHCRAPLSVPRGSPLRMMVEGSAGRRSQHVIRAGGVEVHRCDLGAPRPVTSRAF